MFESEASNLVTPHLTGICRGGPNPDCSNFYIRDRLTGTTTHVTVTVNGGEMNGETTTAVMSRNGRAVIWNAIADNIVPGDTVATCDNNNDSVFNENCSDVFMRTIDPSAAGTGDLTGDGDIDDTVLTTLDGTATTPPSQATRLCPADQVAVANGKAAFLRPEVAGNAAGCPSGTAIGRGADLNGDGDATDQVVHLWDGDSVQNLGVAAAAVALSSSVVAALVDEASQGATGSDLNNDTDKTDTVVEVHPVGSGAWTNVDQAGGSLALSGSVVAFLTDESQQGAANLNADGDASDTVLQVYDASTHQLVLGGTTTPRTRAADEFVLGDRVQTEEATTSSSPFACPRPARARAASTRPPTWTRPTTCCSSSTPSATPW